LYLIEDQTSSPTSQKTARFCYKPISKSCLGVLSLLLLRHTEVILVVKFKISECYRRG